MIDNQTATNSRLSDWKRHNRSSLLPRMRALVFILSSLYLFLEEEIDGETLWLMSTLDSAKTFFPKYKQQLLFLREREKLFTADPQMEDNNENEVHGGSSIVTPDPISPPSDTSIIPSLMTDIREESIDQSSIHDITTGQSSDSIINVETKARLPDEYSISSLPLSLLNDIDRGDLSKFNNHCKNRQILMDTLFFDLTTKYNLW